MTVLHVSAERCLSKHLRRLKEITYVDADINPAIARHTMDIMNIPFRNNSFDLVICCHVLGHVANDACAIRELLRILRPGGIAIFMTVLNPHSSITIENTLIATPEARLQHYGEPDLHRLYGNDFPKRLEEGGFHVQIIDYRQVLGSRLSHRYSLGKGDRELIFRCHKG